MRLVWDVYVRNKQLGFFRRLTHSHLITSAPHICANTRYTYATLSHTNSPHVIGDCLSHHVCNIPTTSCIFRVAATTVPTAHSFRDNEFFPLLSSRSRLCVSWLLGNAAASIGLCETDQIWLYSMISCADNTSVFENQRRCARTNLCISCTCSGKWTT